MITYSKEQFTIKNIFSLEKSNLICFNLFKNEQNYVSLLKNNEDLKNKEYLDIDDFFLFQTNVKFFNF